MFDWKEFKIWVDELSNGCTYLLKGRVFKDGDVVFYVPFNPTISDFSKILHEFQKRFSKYGDFNFKILIQPARYEINSELKSILLNI